MNNDRNREEKLERLFATAGPVRTLTPDPALPMHVRAMAAAGAPRSRTTARRWAWLSLAGAAFALSVIVGGYIGYGVWSSTESTDDAEMVVTALLQDGFVEDMGQSDTAVNEVNE